MKDTSNCYLACADISNGTDFSITTLVKSINGFKDKCVVASFAFKKLDEAIIKGVLIGTYGLRKYKRYEYLAKHGKNRRIRKKNAKRIMHNVTIKRYDGRAWRALTTAKRWNGSKWVSLTDLTEKRSAI